MGSLGRSARICGLDGEGWLAGLANLASESNRREVVRPIAVSRHCRAIHFLIDLEELAREALLTDEELQSRAAKNHTRCFV